MLGGDGGHPSLRRQRQTDRVQGQPCEFKVCRVNSWMARETSFGRKKNAVRSSLELGEDRRVWLGDGAVLEKWDAVRSSLGLGEDRGVWLGGGAVLETVRWHSNMKSPDTTEVSSFLCILCASFARMYICAPHICLMPMEARSGGWIPWEQNYRWLWTTMLALGIEHKFSGRAVSP